VILCWLVPASIVKEQIIETTNKPKNLVGRGTSPSQQRDKSASEHKPIKRVFWTTTRRTTGGCGTTTTTSDSLCERRK